MLGHGSYRRWATRSIRRIHTHVKRPNRMSRESNPAPQAAHAPHAPLTAYYASEQERADFVRRMFDSTAADYDRMERILGFGTGSAYRGQALERAGLRSGMRIVDVGVG